MSKVTLESTRRGETHEMRPEYAQGKPRIATATTC